MMMVPYAQIVRTTLDDGRPGFRYTLGIMDLWISRACPTLAEAETRMLRDAERADAIGPMEVYA